MVKIIFSTTIFLMFFACGKKGDIPTFNSDSHVEPAKIDNEKDLQVLKYEEFYIQKKKFIL